MSTEKLHAINRHYSADDCDRDEAQSRDNEHSILTEARRLCASRQVNNQRLYFLAEMTGHSFYELKQWALVKGLEAWWTIYRHNPKYQRWHAKMDDFESQPRWPL